jgi:hypothetical protein
MQRVRFAPNVSHERLCANLSQCSHGWMPDALSIIRGMAE